MKNGGRGEGRKGKRQELRKVGREGKIEKLRVEGRLGGREVGEGRKEVRKKG